MSVLVFDLHSLLEAIDQLTRVRRENTHPLAADDTDGSEVKTTGGQDKETNTDNMGIQQDDIPREALPDPDWLGTIKSQQGYFCYIFSLLV